MKRIFAITIVFIMIISLAGCGNFGKSKSKIEPNLNKNFSTNVKMTYGDLEAEAIIKRFGSGSWEAEFSAPNTLAGVKLTFVDDDVTASYKGLRFSVPKSALPIKSMLGSLFTIIDDTAEKEKIEVINEKEYLVIEGRTEQGEYKIMLDKETGMLVSFEMPNLDLLIEFSDFQILQDNISETQLEETSEGEMESQGEMESESESESESEMESESESKSESETTLVVE